MNEMSEMNKGVHRTHCCNIHGCKYGDPSCPVESGEIIQTYPCEQCENDPTGRTEDTREHKPCLGVSSYVSGIRIDYRLNETCGFYADASVYQSKIIKIEAHPYHNPPFANLILESGNVVMLMYVNQFVFDPKTQKT
jgi:hypothetical protein